VIALSKRRLAPAIALLALAAAAPPTPMTRQGATKVLEAAGVDPLPDNYPDVIMNGDAASVRALIALGVDPNTKTSLPQPPLELAAMSCSNPRVQPDATAGIVDALVAAGADPNAPGIQGLGPLMIAAQQCGAQVVHHMLAAGAKLNSRTPQGFTPLTMALITRNFEAADALIGAGARLSPAEAAKFTGGPPDAELTALIARATGR
jgi:ankyrin repeat protein